MAERRIDGRCAVPGLAAGILVVLDEDTHSRQASQDCRVEADALRSAVERAMGELTTLSAGADDDAADILGFQVAMLDDPALAEPAFAAIASGAGADRAWRTAMDAEAGGYETADDEYFRARAADIRDIRDRVLAHLHGRQLHPGVPPGSIVAAVDMAPSRFLSVDWSLGGALILTGGSATSHVAMLARSRSVPTVVRLKAHLDELRGEALVDASRGRVILSPGSDARREHERAAREASVSHAAAGRAAHLPAATADGTPVRVLLNIADPHELSDLDPGLCDGIGLVRTELLFHDRAGLPDEASQYAVYRRLVEWAQGRPVTIRTLDAGADKPIPGLTLDQETNPFLGVRGLRLSFARPEIFRTQLRALARAAVHGDLKVMLPMVTLPRELVAARAMLDEELARLAAAGVEARRPSLGIMVEVPAAAIAADLFDAAFFSIGSNDLCQYVAAAGRDVSSLADLAEPAQPAVLRLIRHVVNVAHAANLEVSLCGDAAGDPASIPHLLAAGLRSLSMAPPLVGHAKLAIAQVDLRHVGEAEAWRV
jgi:phosphotransferase system enzyme I (PtsI)